MSGSKYVFDLSGEINKFLTGLKDNLSAWVVTDKTCNGLFRLVEKGKKYDVFSREEDFSKYGGKIIDALKKANAEFSVTLLSDGACENFATAARYLNGDVIALGDKNFLLKTAKYAKENGKACFAVLTTPNFDGLFARERERAETSLKAIVIDSEILVKGCYNYYSSAYSYAAIKTLDLIDYKLAVILKEKQFDEFYFSKARFLSALLRNAFKFSNYHEVILYVALLLSVVSALSNVFTGGGGERLKKAFKAKYPDINEGDCAFYAFIVGANAYHLAFSNDLTVGVLSQNLNADIAAASKLFSEQESVYRKNLKTHSAASLAATLRAVNGVRGKLLPDSSEILTSIKDYVESYVTLSGRELNLSPFNYEDTKEAVVISTYLDKGVTALTVLRDAGVFAAAK